MRILHVTECYAGGVSRAIRTRVQASQEHEHHLLWDGAESPEDEGIWASVTRLPTGMIARVAAVQRSTRLHKPAFVHAHSSWAGLYTRVRKLSSPIVYEPHCFKHDDPSIPVSLRATFRFIERMLARRTWRFGVLSAHEGVLAAELASDVTRVYLPNIPSISPRRDSDPSATTIKIAMVGRVAAQKDPDFFRAVVAELRARGVTLEAVWIGGGDLEQTALLGEDGVRVTGWLDEHQLRQELATSSVYVHSARYEGFPLSVLDAAAMRVPIVVRKIPAFEDTTLLGGKDPASMATLIAEILQNPSKYEEAVRHGDRLLQKMNSNALSVGLQRLYVLETASD